MVLKLYDSDWQEPTLLFTGRVYTLVLWQTEPLLDVTLHAQGEFRLAMPDIPPDEAWLRREWTAGRLVRFGGFNPAGLRGCPTYLTWVYLYGIEPLRAGNLQIRIADESLTYTVDTEVSVAGAGDNAEYPIAPIQRVELLYAGGGRRFVVATARFEQSPSRVRAIDLGGTSILHIQAETPPGYRIFVDRAGTDAIVYLQRINGNWQAQEVRIIAWLD